MKYFLRVFAILLLVFLAIPYSHAQQTITQKEAIIRKFSLLRDTIALSNGLNSNIIIPANAYIVLSGPIAAFSLGGFTGGSNGRVVIINNNVAYTMTIVNEDASSTAANRISTLTGSDVVLGATSKSAATFIYDATASRWILLSTNLFTSGGSAPADAHFYTNQAESGLSNEVVPAANVISILSAADYAAIKVLLALTIGTNTQAYSSILDTVAAGTATNNSFYGKSNAGTYGYYANSTPVWVAAPAVDDTYSGTITTGVAGPAAGLTQWDIVYSKNKAGVEAFYPYDSDGADKAEPPRCVVVSTIVENAAFSCLIEGIVRNDGWGMTTGQDEGKKVYASTTAGGITLTEPTTDGVVIGTVREQNVVHFKFPNSQASTGSGAPVKANTPTLITPNIGVATGTSLMATGRVDGMVGMLISTATSPTTIVVATHGNASYFMNIGNSAANSIFTLSTAAAGLQYCAKNYTGITQVLTFQTSAAGQYIDLDGTLTATGGFIHSAGAAGDGACVIGVDATHWIAYPQKGVWTRD